LRRTSCAHQQPDSGSILCFRRDFGDQASGGVENAVKGSICCGSHRSV
ncbi:uncharacterized protein METZ01_LOCUS374612, partial [marine metagenome]